MMDFVEKLGLTGVDATIRVHPFSAKVYGQTRQVGSKFYIDLFLGPETPKEIRDRVVLHELIHVQQYHQGRLKYEGGSLVWSGDPYPGEEPWETEAEEMVEKLLA